MDINYEKHHMICRKFFECLIFEVLVLQNTSASVFRVIKRIADCGIGSGYIIYYITYYAVFVSIILLGKVVF